MPKHETNQARVFLGRDAWTQHISDYWQSGLTVSAQPTTPLI